jgi:hypothetical protein
MRTEIFTGGILRCNVKVLYRFFLKVSKGASFREMKGYGVGVGSYMLPFFVFMDKPQNCAPSTGTVDI